MRKAIGYVGGILSDALGIVGEALLLLAVIAGIWTILSLL